MKRILCAALTVLFLCVCLAGCGNKNQVDPKLCFLHNNSLPLTSDKETIVRVENLKCLDEGINMYTPKNSRRYIINGMEFSGYYLFNEEDILREIEYSFNPSDIEDLSNSLEDISPYFDKMEKYLVSIYGEGEDYPYKGKTYKEAYIWEISDGEEDSYEIFLAQSKDYEQFKLTISATGRGRSQTEKDFEETMDGLAEKIKDFQEEVDNASPIENYKISPRNDLITQQQFDLLQEDISYEDAMKILDSPKDPSIPENETSFFCEWKGDLGNKYVFLVFSGNKLISKNSSGLE